MRSTRSSKLHKHLGDFMNVSVDALLCLSWIMILLPKFFHSEAHAKVTIDGDTGYFVDSRGFIKLFHGINCVHKFAPFYFPKLLEPHSFRVLRDWGINVIRLEFNWIALKPQEDEISQHYLDIIETIIDNAGLYGVYVIIDFHQDGLSKRLGAIDAVPNWFMDKIKRPQYLFQYPWPLKKDPGKDDWFLTYVTYESAHVFESIYKNVSGIWKYFAEYWTITTSRFGKKDNVLGYNLINEPAPGNVYKNPFLLLPKNSGHNLLSFYDYLVNVIRQTDKDTLIFYESVTYGIYFPFVNGIPGTGIQRVPGLLQDEMARKKSVLSYHYYCWLLELTTSTENMPSWKRYLCDKLLLTYAFNNVRSIVKYTGGGRFLTEFGRCRPDGNPDSINTVECNAVMNAADSNFESWTHWDDYELFPNLYISNFSLKSISRTYPQSTAGQPVELRFDVDSGVFYYAFVPTQEYCTNVNSALLVAEIFVPMSIHYPYGVKTRFRPEQLYYKIYENNTNLMFVYAPCTLINNNIEQMEITIKPKQTQDEHSDNNYTHLPTYSKSISILLIVNAVIFSQFSTYFV
ncbi:unnamed protein product [Schistosoma margrebowiei]|uniref:Glycoside hydrolase family 5 domain-containing protein n=1 Tax=Schistosoma margrebowiei TaxID=48269 RepID=A0AA85AIX1_9TREM|nr:unnamed protein product [Schistosoma margrebowiei]